MRHEVTTSCRIVWHTNCSIAESLDRLHVEPGVWSRQVTSSSLAEPLAAKYVISLPVCAVAVDSRRLIKH